MFGNFQKKPFNINAIPIYSDSTPADSRRCQLPFLFRNEGTRNEGTGTPLAASLTHQSSRLSGVEMRRRKRFFRSREGIGRHDIHCHGAAWRLEALSTQAACGACGDRCFVPKSRDRDAE